MDRLRTVFMGTPDFAVPSLDALIEAGHEVACVYTQPPRPAGRGHKARPCAVHARAAALGLEIRHPHSLRDAAAAVAFAGLAADVVVVAAYGLILPRAILEGSRLGCLNVHASLLPRWRGAAPIQRAILAGDETTGITLMQMDEGLDTGAILAQSALAIGPDMDAGALHDRLAALGAGLLARTLPDFAPARIIPRAQPEDGITYAAKIERAETRINWHRAAIEIERQVRAFSPVPGAWFEAGGTRVRVLGAHVVDGAAGPPGTVIDDAATIACAERAIRLDRLQRQGKDAMEARAFLRGFPLAPGTQLADAS